MIRFAGPDFGTRSLRSIAAGRAVVYSRSFHQATPMTRTAKLLLVPVILFQLLLFSFIARHRFVHIDEGFYLLASRLVLMHKKPYVDFFYTQAPLLPYVYALWMKCFGVTWTSARLLSSLLATLLGALLYQHVAQQTRNWLAGVAAVVLFAMSTPIFGQFTCVSPYPLAGILLFSAYVVVSRTTGESTLWLTVAAGLLLGLSVDTRSYLTLLIPLFIWWVIVNSNAGAKLVSTLFFLGGIAVGLIPSIYLFLLSPPAFLFNNLGYHAIRSSYGLMGWWQEKLFVVFQLFMGGREGNGLQWSILFFISVGLVSSIHKRRSVPALAFHIALVIAISSLLPTPAYVSYFCLCIPFLLVAAVCAVDDFLMKLQSRRERLVATTVCLALLGLYLGTSANDLRKYLVTGNDIAGVPRDGDKSDWRLSRVLEVSEAIDKVASPGEMIASFWPGHVFQTRASPFPGFENDFSLPISERLSAAQRARYHILSPADVERDFASHNPRVVVIRDQILSVPTKAELEQSVRLMDGFKTSLRAHGYMLYKSIGDTSIYVYCSGNVDGSETLQ